ncbi:hypothetical protein [Pontibacter harenae]|uniref:hypothetical protein n=1 Tax=Pontibacter harenae TaxID=2894083 RepID=UPI001E4AE444|nr:hypothetical protein [Pontibacter harenae]MCC9165457.1 hypothetical protein [Pontibacter harenae]
MKNLYFKNSFVSIFYDKKQRLGKAVWHGELIGSEYREAVLLCLDLIERHELRGWLGDNRKMKSIRLDDLEWSLKVFIPQLLESPLLRLANVASENKQNRDAIEKMYSKANNSEESLVVHDFQDIVEAEAWLVEVAGVPGSDKHSS